MGHSLSLGEKMIGVIGACGFVGKALCRSLRANDLRFIEFDVDSGKGAGDIFYLDVRECGSHTNLGECETIVNLAAEHRDDIFPLDKYFSVNVEGAKNVCAAAVANGVERIVFTSSVAIYGFAAPDTGEDGEPNYFNTYGETKYLAEQVYLEWQAKDPLVRSLVIVRPTVIFGQGNRGNVFNLLRQIATGRFVMFGDGNNIKSMAYVDNVASFLVRCTSLEVGVHTFNYVDKPDLSMNELVQVARKALFEKTGVGLRLPAFIGILIGKGFDVLAWLMRRPMPVSSIRVKKFMATTQFSSAVQETGFEAPYTLAEGLEKTLQYEFLEDNRHKPTHETE